MRETATCVDIFLSKVLDVTMGTFRVQMIISRKKLIAGVLGFFEVLIFILIVSKVIQDIGNWLNVIAYCGVFATGNMAHAPVAAVPPW